MGFKTIPEAATSKSTADEVEEKMLEHRVAVAIEDAAKCGQHSLIWHEKLPDALIKKLEGAGYTVKNYEMISEPGTIIPDQYIIEDTREDG